MKKTIINYIIAIIGFIMLGTGLYLVKTLIETKGLMLTLPYVCIGIGCGLFGQGMGNIISYKTIKNNPETQRQLEINKNDERNITIANRAKAKAYNMMIFVFGALILSFALMRVDMVTILLLVFAYLFIQGYGIYYHIKYNKEM